MYIQVSTEMPKTAGKAWPVVTKFCTLQSQPTIPACPKTSVKDIFMVLRAACITLLAPTRLQEKEINFDDERRPEEVFGNRQDAILVSGSFKKAGTK